MAVTDSPVLYTVGHSTRSLSELISILRSADVQRLADVRGIPRSRKNPQFNIDTLPRELAVDGIDYRHLPALGGRRGARKGALSRNDYWRIQAFRNYADYAETETFRAGLDQLEALARERPTAIMCAEALWWRCHRRLVADYMMVRGWRIIHLMGPDQQQPGELTPAAVPQADGTIRYPAGPQEALPWADS